MPNPVYTRRLGLLHTTVGGPQMIFECAPDEHLVLRDVRWSSSVAQSSAQLYLTISGQSYPIDFIADFGPVATHTWLGRQAMEPGDQLWIYQQGPGDSWIVATGYMFPS